MTSQGHSYAQFQRALKTGNAHLALAAAAEIRQVGLADALSLCLVIRDDNPPRYDRAAVRWLTLLLTRDRKIQLAELRELADLLVGLGRHDQVATLRLERWLHARGLLTRPTVSPDAPSEEAGSARHRLEPELVPSPLWRKSGARALPRSQWRKIRTRVIAQRGTTCEICGADTPSGIVCHERWEYDDTTAVATLVGFELCCRLCSFGHHPGQAAQVLSDMTGVIDHVARVNGMTAPEVEAMWNAASVVWKRRGKVKWRQQIRDDILAAHPELRPIQS